MFKFKKNSQAQMSILLFILCLCLFSCASLFDYEEPKVVTVFPVDDQRGVSQDEPIKVTFNEPVKIESAEKAFSLASNGDTDGSFAWENERTMVFKPKRRWTSGEKYTIIIERSVEDLNRNKLQRKYMGYFYIGDDFDHPYIVNKRYNPYIQTNPVTIEIKFSKPMDVNSIHQAVSISPGYDFRLDMPSPYTTLTLLTTEVLPSLGRYQLTITTDAKSRSGLPLLRTYEYDFAMYDDLVKPEIMLISSGTNFDPVTLNYTYIGDLVYDPLNPDPDYTTMEKRDVIVIDFSEQMEHESVEKAFKINGLTNDHDKIDINGNFYWTITPGGEDRLIFYPDENGYQQNTIYTVYLEKTARDPAGNELDQKSDEYTFQTNYIIPEVRQVIFNYDPNLDPVYENVIGDALDSSVIENHNTIVEDVYIRVLALTENAGKCDLTIIFNDDALDYIDYHSLYNNIKITHVNGAAGDPAMTDFFVDPANNLFKIFLKGLVFDGDDPDYIANTYKIELIGGKNGVVDLYGNYLEKTLLLYFKVDHLYVP